MKTIRTVALAVLCAGLCAVLTWTPGVRLSIAPVEAAAAAQQQRGGGAGRGAPMSTEGIKRGAYTFPGTDRQMEFAYFASSKVDKKKKAPLVVALHGAGGQPGQIIAMIRDQAQKNGYVVVAPIGEASAAMFGASGTYENREIGDKDVMNVLDLARKEYSIDETRIYVLGHSAGGAGAVFHGTTHQDIFAAFAAAAPALPFNPEILDDAKSPGLFIVADNDELLSMQRVQPWADKILSMKGPHEFVVLKGAGHGGVVTQGGEQIFKFFAKHVKTPAAAAAE